MVSQAAKEKVTIIGSGNWGSAIAKIVGRNVLGNDEFAMATVMATGVVVALMALVLTGAHKGARSADAADVQTERV